VRRSVCSIALLLVCLEWKPNSYDYRTQLPSFPKLQHCPMECSLVMPTTSALAPLSTGCGTCGFIVEFGYSVMLGT